MKRAQWNTAGALLASVALSLTSASHTVAQVKKPDAKDAKNVEKKDAGPTKDVLVLRSGSKVEGKIQKETDSTIEFLLVASGGLSATRTYDKSDILDIQRDLPADAAAVKAAPTSEPRKKGDTVIGAGGTQIYMVELTGEFKRDVALTPMKDVMKDVKKYQPNVLVVKVNCDFVNSYGQKLPEFVNDVGSFFQLELARQLEVLLTDQIDHDSSWTVKPRLVFWVDKAMGGVAFLPFVCNDLYYTSSARHGGIGWLDLLFEGVGDEVVREKQRSLLEGRAEGLAIKGGHPVEVLRAMSRIDHVLSVTFEGGKPIFHENNSGDILLTDDGNLQEGRRDTVEDVLRGRGNDVLTLDSEMAKKLGMSKGTVDDEKELMFALGYERDYKLTSGRSKDILSTWSKGLRDAEVQIRVLLRDADKIEVAAPGEWQQRTDARNKRISIYNDILALLTRYGEGINPGEIGGAPDQFIQQLKLLIEQIKQQQRLDKRR